MAEEVVLNVDLHYLMNDEKRHSMDADVHIKCESCIIDVLNHLNDVLDEDFQIEVSAIEVGSLIDKLKIINPKRFPISTLNIIIGGLLGYFFNYSPSKDELENSLSRAELIQKIKDGNFTENEIIYVFEGKPEVLKYRNKFFESIIKEENVNTVECISYNLNDNIKVYKSHIDRKDFNNQIIKSEIHSQKTDYLGTDVLVVSPILYPESKAKWKGIFSGRPINFELIDSSFLKQVYEKEVLFSAGTKLKCDVYEIRTLVFDTSGNCEEKSTEYKIDNVTSWDDSVNFQQFTRKYKRLLNQSTQLELFNPSDLD